MTLIIIVIFAYANVAIEKQFTGGIVRTNPIDKEATINSS